MASKTVLGVEEKAEIKTLLISYACKIAISMGIDRKSLFS
jgi:hypothetical protein